MTKTERVYEIDGWTVTVSAEELTDEQKVQMIGRVIGMLERREAKENEKAAPVCADCGKPATGDKILPDGTALPLCLQCTIKRMKAS